MYLLFGCVNTLFTVCLSVCVFVQITHKTTGQVMVMKEIVRCTDESKSSFLKEVCTKLHMYMCNNKLTSCTVYLALYVLTGYQV